MTRLSSKKPPRNIIRVDNDANGDHTWVVTLQRKRAIIVKRFTDSVYGGNREALSAAVEYRDSFLARDKPFDHQIWIRSRLRKNNTSGIPGVQRYEVVDNPNTGHVRAYWLASWTNEFGATRQRKFSIARYGEEEAKLLAIAERDYQLRRVVAIKAAGSEVRPQDQEEIWKASQVETGRGRRGRRKNRKAKVGHERRGEERIQIIEATIDQDGSVGLLEPVKLTSKRNAVVIILPEGQEGPRTRR